MREAQATRSWEAYCKQCLRTLEVVYSNGCIADFSRSRIPRRMNEMRMMNDASHTGWGTDGWWDIIGRHTCSCWLGPLYRAEILLLNFQIIFSKIPQTSRRFLNLFDMRPLLKVFFSWLDYLYVGPGHRSTLRQTFSFDRFPYSPS